MRSVLPLLVLLVLAACSADKYPWPDLAVDESAWAPANPPAPLPLAGVAR